MSTKPVTWEVPFGWADAAHEKDRASSRRPDINNTRVKTEDAVNDEWIEHTTRVKANIADIALVADRFDNESVWMCFGREETRIDARRLKLLAEFLGAIGCEFFPDQGPWGR